MTFASLDNLSFDGQNAAVCFYEVKDSVQFTTSSKFISALLDLSW